MYTDFEPVFLGAVPQPGQYKTAAEYNVAMAAYQKKQVEEKAKLQAKGVYAPGYQEYMTEYESRMKDAAAAAKLATSPGYWFKKNWGWVAAGVGALLLVA